MGEVAVVGVGNRFRGDDGAGWRVIDALEKKVTSGVKLLKVGGDIAEMVDLFARYPVVFLVDAYAATGSQEGCHRIDLLREPLTVENRPTSTHGFTCKEAFELAKILGGLPSKLTLYAIPGRNFTFSEGLSPSVVEAVDQIVCALLNEEEIHACMKQV